MKKYNAIVDPKSELLISAGSKPIIFMLLKAVLNQGDEVVIPEPSWLSYKEQIKLVGAVPISIPHSVSLFDWEKYLTEKTKVIIINNPTNPSGRLFTYEELNYLLKIAKEHEVFILSDEAYSDFVPSDKSFISFASVDKSKEHCLVVNSLSKNMGMSGWRVGYAIAHNGVIKQLLKLNQHIITCAPTVLQDYMAEHFDEILNSTLPQAIEMAEKRRKVEGLLRKIGINYLPGSGTFYFMLDVSSFIGTTEELVYDLLFNHNIATVPGGAYGESTSNFIRFGIGVESIENIERSLKIIKSFLDVDEYNNDDVQLKMRDYGIV